MENSIFGKVDQYISERLGNDDKALAGAIESLENAGIDNMSISPNQGKFLQVLAKMVQAKNILELGTLAGYSTIWLARALTPDGKIVTIESDPQHAEIARENFKTASLEYKIDLRVGNALDILPQLEAEDRVFDMVFIDADKPPYVEYFESALRLARPGTVIVADNVIRNGKILDSNSTDKKVSGVQRFNDMLSRCGKVTATILQTFGIKEYDGMAIAVVD